MFATLTGAIALGWTALSPLAALAGISGIGLILLAVFGLAMLPGIVTAFLPDVVKRGLIVLGVALVVCAGLYQLGRARGVHDAYEIATAKALAAEATRADRSDKIAADIAAQAATDHERLAADNAKLKDLNDVLSKDKDRARVCVDRDLARRLRNL